MFLSPPKSLIVEGLAPSAEYIIFFTSLNNLFLNRTKTFSPFRHRRINAFIIPVTLRFLLSLQITVSTCTPSPRNNLTCPLLRPTILASRRSLLRRLGAFVRAVGGLRLPRERTVLFAEFLLRHAHQFAGAGGGFQAGDRGEFGVVDLQSWFSMELQAG